MPKDNEVDEKVIWPERMVNMPCPDGTTDRIVGFRIPEGHPALGKYGLSEGTQWLQRVTLGSAATVAELRAEVERLRSQVSYEFSERELATKQRDDAWERESSLKQKADAAERRVAGLEEELAKLRLEWQASLGVGDGSGQLIVHGKYDSIKECQRKLLSGEAAERRVGELETEVSKWQGLYRSMELVCEVQERRIDRLTKLTGADPT